MRKEVLMLTFIPTPGQAIDSAAAEMIALANGIRGNVVAKFNDIEIQAGPCAEQAVGVAAIKAYYKSECERRAEAYRNSPEGKRAAAKAEERRSVAQAKMDQLMAQLPTLDFSNFITLINWFDKLQDPSDYIGVNCPWSQIVETFAQHGFTPGMNCGADFDEEDEANFARYLIGQALSYLASEVHAIHHIYRKFAADWRFKFDKVV